MYNAEKKVTVEWISESGKTDKLKNSVNVSNPINSNSDTNKLSKMVKTVLDNELPMLKNNSLLHDLVLYTLTDKMKTVQTVENVLSYIKSNNAKSVEEVCINNGEIRIKCSV